MFFGALLMLPETGATQSQPKTETIYIQTDDVPPAPSPAEQQKRHPFFSEPTGNEAFEEAMEKIQDLEQRIEKLEKNSLMTSDGNMRLESTGGLALEAKGDITVTTPGTVVFKAKSVKIPRTPLEE